ncbi:hypothetical protein HK44_003110 [Pseudomonas fluorescens HK44]|uniref:Uncharacterized protein n=1 Tax=Pseudomonas fluorescens HK44 TaxID=1042209 RepID=A0A010RZ85_PSEFL|nr:hypothetical protein HK44_003110 [Pseudomonas fluorescens HK44]
MDQPPVPQVIGNLRFGHPRDTDTRQRGFNHEIDVIHGYLPFNIKAGIIYEFTSLTYAAKAILLSYQQQYKVTEPQYPAHLQLRVDR